MSKKQKTEQVLTGDVKKDNTLWRKPITLESIEDEDPLAELYQGIGVKKTIETLDQTPKEKTVKPVRKRSDNSEKFLTRKIEDKSSSKLINRKTKERSEISSLPKISEDELKQLLRIKNDSFQFTDIREILRGKSFEIYVYLRFLSGVNGICKIKSLDLMKILDISRPTLFKQSSWLTQLSLIEKSSVPGDHLGTSYIVHRLEDVLPIEGDLIQQVELEIENLRNAEK